MKLASLKSGRDGRLVVVSRDLTRAVSAEDIAPTLQLALENWSELSSELEARFEALQSGELEGEFILQGDGGVSGGGAAGGGGGVGGLVAAAPDLVDGVEGVLEHPPLEGRLQCAAAAVSRLRDP